MTINSSQTNYYILTITELTNKINKYGALDLSNQQITSLPDGIGQLQDLKELDLKNNNLESLPDSIGNCKGLKSLFLQNNKLKKLPDGIGQLQNLKKLDLKKNNLKSLPELLSNCKNLRVITLAENRFNNLFNMIVVLSKITSLVVDGLPHLSSSNRNPIINNDSTLQESECDVVVINPTCEGGGDYELAKKIEKLASTSYRVITISTNEKEGETEGRIEEKIKKKVLMNRLIITPYNIISPERLQEIIKNNFIITNETKVLMIDEMDARQEFSIDTYRESLQQIQINNVYETKLGFAKDSIGYLPLTQAECTAIQQRSKAELKTLMTIDDSAHYYLSYLNSSRKISAMQVFIINTLMELNETPSSINYICSIGATSNSDAIISLTNAAYRTKAHLTQLNIAEKFSTMNLIVLNPENNDIFQKELQTIGNGIIPINIIFMTTLSMSKDTWHNFIAISKAGMMTGDQSLSDYLSIKKEMPFYEMQYWKLPLRDAILTEAEKFKDKSFKEYVSTKFVGDSICGMLYKFVDDTMLNDTSLNDFKKFGALIAQKTANDSCIEKIHALMS